MAHTNLSHRRTHNLLLISKLLGQRENISSVTSPFTLVLDTLEQTARPLVREYIRRANFIDKDKLSKLNAVIYLGFETVQKPTGVDHFIPCFDKSPVEVKSAVSEVISSTGSKRILIIIDSVHALCTISMDPRSGLNLAAYLSSFLAPQGAAAQPPLSSSSQPTSSQSSSSVPSQSSQTTSTSLIAIYHTDIPLPTPPATFSHPSQTYQPSPLSLLSYLATTILTIHSLPTLLAAHLARQRSQMPPTYGLQEEKQGIIIGLKPNKFKGSTLRDEHQGVVLELEHRRKSGRGVREWFFLPKHLKSTSAISTTTTAAGMGTTSGGSFREPITLLDDHPLFRQTRDQESDPNDHDSSSQDLTGLTFALNLTDRQKLERDGVVLPYFDAQMQNDGSSVGIGDGGRILYDMGSEDDFDEEEDEI